MRISIPFILSLLLFGCSLHTPLEVQPPSAPGAYLHDQQGGVLPPQAEKWWLAFHDNELNLLMVELFAQNLELEQMVARLGQVEALVSIAGSSRVPTVTANANASRSLQPGVMGDFEGNARQLSVHAGYEVDLWGKLAARDKAARQDYSASQQELQSLLLGLSARLADLYFLAMEQHAQLALAEQLITSFGDTYARVERRYQLGLADAIELYQSRQALSAAKASRELFAANLAKAEHAISVILGKYPRQRHGGWPGQLPEPPKLFPVGIPADLLIRRPDLQAAMQRIEAADSRVAAAIADRFPSINLSGSLGSLRQEVTGGLIEGGFWSLLGQLTLPIVDGARRQADIERQQAVLQEAVAVYRQQVLRAFQEVEDALVNNYADQQRIENMIETADATQATLRLATERYLAGLSDYLPVLTSQRADFEARSRLLMAKRQLLADRVTLARALGGSWMLDIMKQKMTENKEAKK